MWLPRWLGDKELPANAGIEGLISGSGRYPGGGNGNSLQYSCLENWIDRGAWWATVHGVAKSLSDMTAHIPRTYTRASTSFSRLSTASSCRNLEDRYQITGFGEVERGEVVQVNIVVFQSLSHV